MYKLPTTGAQDNYIKGITYGYKILKGKYKNLMTIG